MAIILLIISALMMVNAFTLIFYRADLFGNRSMENNIDNRRLLEKIDIMVILREFTTVFLCFTSVINSLDYMGKIPTNHDLSIISISAFIMAIIIEITNLIFIKHNEIKEKIGILKTKWKKTKKFGADHNEEVRLYNGFLSVINMNSFRISTVLFIISICIKAFFNF
jgi:hypothetical protein